MNIYILEITILPSLSCFKRLFILFFQFPFDYLDKKFSLFIMVMLLTRESAFTHTTKNVYLMHTAGKEKIIWINFRKQHYIYIYILRNRKQHYQILKCVPNKKDSKATGYNSAQTTCATLFRSWNIVINPTTKPKAAF